VPQPMTSASRIKTAQRRAVVLAKRLSGMHYRQIAQEVLEEFGAEELPKHWDELYAYKDVKRELDRLNRERDETTAAIRRLEVERLDALLRTLWPKRADPPVTDRILKIVERRAKLLGLDAPERKDITSAGQPIESAVVIYLPENSRDESERSDDDDEEVR